MIGASRDVLEAVAVQLGLTATLLGFVAGGPRSGVAGSIANARTSSQWGGDALDDNPVRDANDDAHPSGRRASAGPRTEPRGRGSVALPPSLPQAGTSAAGSTAVTLHLVLR